MAVLVILLLTGLCIPSISFASDFFFINKQMTWDDAAAYCKSEYSGLIRVNNEYRVGKVLNTPTGGYKGKAWMGLFWAISVWNWVDKSEPTVVNWEEKEPSLVSANKFCVSMDLNTSLWRTNNCSETKSSICCNETRDCIVVTTPMTWKNARSNCVDLSSTLAIVTKEMSLTSDSSFLPEDAWIGLSRDFAWFWTESSSYDQNTVTYWKDGQPDNLNGEEDCGAVDMTDGTWSDEQCNATYPVVCTGVSRSKQTVVGMKIKASANLEDPTWRADLEKQLSLEFAKKGMTDVKLTWRKLIKGASDSQKEEPQHCSYT